MQKHLSAQLTNLRMSLTAYITEGDECSLLNNSREYLIEIAPLVFRAIDPAILEFCSKTGSHIDLYDADVVPLKHLPGLEMVLQDCYKKIEEGSSTVEVDLGTIRQADGSYTPRVESIAKVELLEGIECLLKLVSLAITKQRSVMFAGD
ncbi:MAG: hypothetical protein WCI46_09760 [Verrucomicrobiota bacterium]